MSTPRYPGAYYPSPIQLLRRVAYSSANQYPISFGYRAQDGYYYGPNGKVGLYHRGNDRACPVGVPIKVGGVTIGYTGATGLVSGPHLHTQAMRGSYDVNPRDYEFQPGKVTVAGNHYQFGQHVRMQITPETEIIYAHLSSINVRVGQIIEEEEVAIYMTDTDAKRWFYWLRGRQPSSTELATIKKIPVTAEWREAFRNQYAHNGAILWREKVQRSLANQAEVTLQKIRELVK